MTKIILVLVFTTHVDSRIETFDMPSAEHCSQKLAHLPPPSGYRGFIFSFCMEVAK